MTHGTTNRLGKSLQQELSVLTRYRVQAYWQLSTPGMDLAGPAYTQLSTFWYCLRSLRPIKSSEWIGNPFFTILDTRLKEDVR